MATHKTPIRHVCGIIDPGRYKEVRHYHILEVLHGKPFFDGKLNVSKDRHYSHARNVRYWLKQRSPDGKKWGKPITGLKPTHRPMVFYGDIPKKRGGKFIPQHLLIFRFSHGAETLTIDFYPYHYPPQPEIRELAELMAMEDLQPQKEGL